MLVEMAAAIKSTNKVQAFDITEVPNQTDPFRIYAGFPESTSLKRRINRLSESKTFDWLRCCGYL
ncbi:MAG: hypothetical protein CM15mP121_1240 [Bacteroidota bacterium]|nr:MAG: hypothetical protein CM15mP121_1240 [Bacteroidota bacterium]